MNAQKTNRRLSRNVTCAIMENLSPRLLGRKIVELISYSRFLSYGFSWLLLICLGTMLSEEVIGQTREEKVRGDRLKFETDGFWIYNNFAKAVEQAKESKKPILAVMRCVPCVECVKLDDELVEAHPRLQQLLKQFVRVRLISTNGLDLNLFQFDTDQSFNVFLLNADGTIYGRFGTRSDREHWEDDVSVEGMANALQGALELHAKYPENKDLLRAKRGTPPLFPTPEKFPSLASKYGPTLDYEGNVVKSCIHCHQIGDAIKQHYRSTTGNIPDEVLFPYPHPKIIGLILDPEQRAKVKKVIEGSPAAKGGLLVGDVIETMNGQPLLSIADVQWVLHHIPSQGGKVDCSIKRGTETLKLSLKLEDQWKTQDDLAWRASTWELRRMAFGGMFLKPATDEELKKAKVSEKGNFLRVQHVGQFAPHDVAKKAGFLKDDIVLSFDRRNDFARETDIVAYVLKKLQPGQRVTVEILRDGVKKELVLPVPELK